MGLIQRYKQCITRQFQFSSKKEQKILDYLAQQGITISICYGYMGGKFNRIGYSVTCLFNQFDEFEKPFAANTLEQAIEIAYIECIDRKWAKPFTIGEN